MGKRGMNLSLSLAILHYSLESRFYVVVYDIYISIFKYSSQSNIHVIIYNVHYLTHTVDRGTSSLAH